MQKTEVVSRRGQQTSACSIQRTTSGNWDIARHLAQLQMGQLSGPCFTPDTRRPSVATSARLTIRITRAAIQNSLRCGIACQGGRRSESERPIMTRHFSEGASPVRRCNYLGYIIAGSQFLAFGQVFPTSPHVYNKSSLHPPIGHQPGKIITFVTDFAPFHEETRPIGGPANRAGAEAVHPTCAIVSPSQLAGAARLSASSYRM